MDIEKLIEALEHCEKCIGCVNCPWESAMPDCSVMQDAAQALTAMQAKLDKQEKEYQKVADQNSFLRATLLDIEESCKWFRQMIELSDQEQPESGE